MKKVIQNTTLFSLIIIGFVSFKIGKIPIEIVDVQTNEVIVGYHNAKYLIGKTEKKDVLDFEVLADAGLLLVFDKNEKIKAAELFTGNFKTNRDVKIGDKTTKVQKAFGKPQSDGFNLTKGNRQIGSVNGLFYENASFFTDSNNNVARIVIGKIF